MSCLIGGMMRHSENVERNRRFNSQLQWQRGPTVQPPGVSGTDLTGEWTNASKANVSHQRKVSHKKRKYIVGNHAIVMTGAKFVRR